jgi:hypothetical protein
VQHFPAGGRARYEPGRQPVNQCMCKPFLGHAALDPRNSVPDLPCHIVDSSDKFVRIHFQLFGLSAPVADLDIAEAVNTFLHSFTLVVLDDKGI